MDQALDKLPSIYGDVMRLVRDDLTQSEIAERLRIPVGTVESRTAKAADTLRAELASVQEADHVGFPSPGRGGQALGGPGVRHHPHLEVRRPGTSGLRTGSSALAPPAMISTGRGAAARMASGMLIGRWRR